MAKKFMYVSLGILALVMAFHLGARLGQAQPASPEIAVGTGMIGHEVEICQRQFHFPTRCLTGKCYRAYSPRIWLWIKDLSARRAPRHPDGLNDEVLAPCQLQELNCSHSLGPGKKQMS